MANTIKIRRSATSGATPTTSQLALGELAINTYDGKLFLKKDNGSASVIEIGGDVSSSTPRKVLLYEKANTGNADSFDGSETRFQLRDENGAIITDIASAYQLLISVDGVVQESNSSSSGANGYYITNNTASGTDIVFLAAPASGSDFFGTSVTTANFYVNNISESGSTTTIDGLVKVTGGIQAAENVTPTTGSGVEIFKPSSTAGQIQAFDRSGSAWMDLILKGKEQIFYADGSEAMRITQSGNIAIGPNTQEHGLLTLSKSASSAFNALVIQQGNTGSTASDGLHIGIDTAVHAYIIHKENRDIIFGTSNNEAMRIDASGRLGIGTNTPTRTLTVQGDMNLLSGSSIESDSSGGNLLIQGGSTYPGGCILMGGGSGTNDIRFSTTGNSTSVSSTEVMRILSGGGLTFNGDTAQANALDDYEEGTFSPYVSQGVDDGSGGAPPYAIRAGRYVKIGNMVYTDIYFRFATGATSTGALGQIRGLPFNISNLTYGVTGALDLTRGGGTSSFHDTTNQITQGYGSSNSDLFTLYYGGGLSFVFGGSNNANISGKYWIGTFCYQTNS